MWASIVKAFSGIFSFLGALVEWRREAQLREDGAIRESLKQYQEAANARTMADEIDRRPDIVDRDELLLRLRKGHKTYAPRRINVGPTDLPGSGHPGVAQWSQG